MIGNFFEICQKVSFKLNLFELLIGLAIIVIFMIVVFLLRRLVKIIRNEGIIDERMRERRSRIARVAAEIEYTAVSKSESESELKLELELKSETASKPETESKFNENGTQRVQTAGDPPVKIDKTSETPTTTKTHQIIDPKQVLDNNSEHDLNKGQLSINQQGSSSSVEGTKKKTRAISMEERWADFDRKRAKRNSA